MESPGSKVFIIGGRRGLGKHIKDEWKRLRPEDTILTSSRSPGADFICDFSNDESVSRLLSELDKEKPSRLFCIPGGGPYGDFAKKEWKDHSWGLSVTLLSPMRIAHHALRAPYCEQIILVGSSIAEDSADKYAASYAAAKHGLKGFVRSLVLEEKDTDIRLFSPGYMSTDMLPQGAALKLGKVVSEPQAVALAFVEWALSPKAAWHKTYTP